MRKVLFSLIIGFVIITAVSCSVQKRRYLNGFYVSHKSKLKSEKKEVIVGNSINLSSEILTAKSISFEILNSELELISSTNSHPTLLPKLFKKVQLDVNLNNIKKFKKKKTPQESTPSQKRTGGIILSCLGIFTFLIGLFLLSVSTGIGVFFMVIGLVLYFVGFAALLKNKKGIENPQEEMQDVVYLKNGRIIKGSIIEQAPGVNLKIKTKDGNLFVYEAKEVEKMAKEKVK